MGNQCALYGTLHKCADMSPAFSASQSSLSLMDTVIRGMLTQVLCHITTPVVACTVHQFYLFVSKESATKEWGISSQTNINDLVVCRGRV